MQRNNFLPIIFSHGKILEKSAILQDILLCFILKVLIIQLEKCGPHPLQQDLLDLQMGSSSQYCHQRL